MIARYYNVHENTRYPRDLTIDQSLRLGPQMTAGGGIDDPTFAT